MEHCKKSFGFFQKNIQSRKNIRTLRNLSKDINKDFIFTTNLTLSNSENLKRFEPDAFDYIIIDETHRAGAATYQKIINYFSPKFLLGMTASPERTDDYDIFDKLFEHNIAYEDKTAKGNGRSLLFLFITLE